MSLAVTFALICVTLVAIYKYLTWNLNYWQKQGVRGPKPHVLKGNFTKSLSGGCNFVEELHDIYLKYKSKERFVGFFTARTPQLLVLDPALALQILTTNFNNFRDNEASKWTTPEIDRLRFASPMVCTGSTWSETRLEIGPASSVAKLRSFYPAMKKTAENLSDYIQTHIEDVDIKESSRKFAIELMSDFIWGINADTFKDDKPNAIQDAANCMIKQALKCVGYYRKTAAWPWLRRLRPERFFPKSVDIFLTHLTEKSAKLRAESPNTRSDVLNHLLQLQSKHHLSEARMVGYATTILMDGFETAAIAIAHCILMLGRNQNAQKKLRKEILDNLDESGALSFNRLHDLPYLDQCVHESLRIFPPVPIFSKLCTSPIQLENSDGSRVQLQPGDTVYISIFSFHRDEELFEKPNEFIPERFDPEIGGTQKYRKIGAFLPFGDGPRICLGMKLGLMEIKVAVAEVVRKFEISVESSTRSDNRVEPSSFLLSLEGGIRLKLKPAV